MRIVDVRERTVDISRYSDPAIPSGGLTTSIVALTTDVVRNGRPVIGFGFPSVGRFGQGGLIRERFAPRLLVADEIDPLEGWRAMMKGEKPGGHGERCVAVGTLDMALWDAAAKIADLPLHVLLRQRFGDRGNPAAVSVYASGGYP
ncbi:MAG TPA: mandelate racemase, partial [Reyranella sp.]|nr:mandelate racemase [Reyranella sp.]